MLLFVLWKPPQVMVAQQALLAARMEDRAFAEGRGPGPATKDNATDFVGVEDDPLQ
jgi:hypothetical protein